MILLCGVGLSVINAGSVFADLVCRNMTESTVMEAINVADALWVICGDPRKHHK